MRMTIIPADGAIGLDGVFLRVAVDAPDNVHAIQIYDTFAEIEYNDGKPNAKVTGAALAALSGPYLSVYRAEQQRIIEHLAASTPPTPYSVWDEDAQAWVADRDAICRRLESDMHHYIFVTHDYPQPTQITLQALYSDPDSTADQRAACKQIFDWIKGVVLKYYYSRKAEILKSSDPESVRWDFGAICDAAAPGITLAQIISLQEA